MIPLLLETGPLSVSSKVSDAGHKPVDGIDLPTLMSLLPEEQIDVMKIDVEGAEEVFLCAHHESLARVRHLIVEIHPLACDEQRVRSVLRQHFPVVEDVADRISSKPLLYCRRV